LRGVGVRRGGGGGRGKKGGKRGKRRGRKRKESIARPLASSGLEAIFSELASDLPSFTPRTVSRLSAVVCSLTDGKIVDWPLIKTNRLSSNIRPVSADWKIFTDRLLERGFLKKTATSKDLFLPAQDQA